MSVNELIDALIDFRRAGFGDKQVYIEAYDQQAIGRLKQQDGDGDIVEIVIVGQDEDDDE